MRREECARIGETAEHGDGGIGEQESTRHVLVIHLRCSVNYSDKDLYCFHQ